MAEVADSTGSRQSARDILMALVRQFEGLRLRAYYCPAGVLTCGYGATGPDITPATVWTPEQAEERMTRDAELYLAAARKLCPGLSPAPLAAVADFAYNLGATRLSASTLRRKINKGDMEAAAMEFSKWVYAGGRKLPGLVARRECERRIFSEGGASGGVGT